MFKDRFPARVVVDGVLATLTTRRAFTALCLDLYEESRLVIGEIARQHEPARITDRTRAIGCGILVRLDKFMLATATLVKAMGRCGEVLNSLNRCQMEGAINLQLLLQRDSPEAYQDFVVMSLGPEREFYDRITANIEAHAGVRTPMEDRMLASILRVCERSGLKIEDIPVKHQDWGGNMRAKMSESGWDGLYTAYRGASHSVHGTWVDMLMSHLEWSEEGFAVEPAFDVSDTRMLSPTARINLEAEDGLQRAVVSD